MRDQGWQGQLWAKRGKATMIHDYEHQKNAFNYILRHNNEGAWVWTDRDPATPPSRHFAK
jgi:hypothetical protein